jgi:hypothetical protein
MELVNRSSLFTLLAGTREEEGVVDDVSDNDDEAVSAEILQEMTLEKFESVSNHGAFS